MIEREHDRLSVSRQCQLVGLSRSTWYYRAVGESAETLALMQRIDQLYLEYPFYGSRQMMRPSGTRGKAGRSAPGAAADAAVGVGGDLPQAAHQRPRTRTIGCTPIYCEGLRLSARIRSGARTSSATRRPEPCGGERPLPSVRRSGPVEAGGNPIRGTPVKAEAAPTKTGHASTVRWRGSGKRKREGVREEPAAESLSR